ncbi:MAG: peptidoglycan DD-metalloendopeptidase family protein [Candidatus Korobacteraceae bacterium]|jgi:peptidase M23-like protein
MGEADRDQHREKMMRFRLHSVVAVLVAIALFPTLARSQQTPPAAPAQPMQPAASGQQTPPAPAQEQKSESMEKTPEAPVEPIMSGPYPVMSKAAEERGRQLFEMFNHSEFSQMWTSLSDGRRRVLVNAAAKVRPAAGAPQVSAEERFIAGNKRYHEALGNETSMQGENIVPYLFAPDTIYTRLSTFPGARVPAMFAITINQLGQIDDFAINPMRTIPEGRYAGYEDTAKLKLPFEGEWLVYQGGRNIFENAYSAADDQRYAIDFVLLKNGKLFSGAGVIGSKPEDYYCYGQPILAPADGTVVKAIGTFNDYPPGRPAGDPPDGNVLIISHSNGESSFFNHLKQNSLRVKLDDKVKQGEVIAECGNSGAGLVPHVHYHLQRSMGVGLPAQFVDYIADGKLVASGEPKRGQLVKNAPAPPAMPAAPAMPAGTPSNAAPSKMPAPASK